MTYCVRVITHSRRLIYNLKGNRFLLKNSNFMIKCIDSTYYGRIYIFEYTYIRCMRPKSGHVISRPCVIPKTHTGIIHAPYICVKYNVEGLRYFFFFTKKRYEDHFIKEGGICPLIH